MRRKNIPLTLTTGSLLGLAAFFPYSAMAQEYQSWRNRIKVDTQLILQYINEENPDLTTDNENNKDSLSTQLQVTAGARINEHLSGFISARGLNINGDSGFEDDTGETETIDDAFLELRQLWLRYANIAQIAPLYLQVGRQRLREPRALWWNSDNDLVKLAYEGTVLSGFIAAGEDTRSYRAGSDNDFRKDDENRFRTLGELSWQYKYDHFLEGRFAYEKDHSGTEPAGSFIRADNRDDEDLQALWVGPRLTGTYIPDRSWMRVIKYRADIVGLVGEVDEIRSTRVNDSTRQVTGSVNRDLRAWAFDGNVILLPGIFGNPALTFGYAFGSGDDDPDDGKDNAFRQTGLEGNSSRTGLERKQQRNYGEVLRPELSNLHIASAGASIPISDHSDVGLTWFYYRLDEKATDLRSDGITATMNGRNRSVGQAADLILNVGIKEELGIAPPMINAIDFRFVAGSFFPGDAYDVTGDDNIYRIFTELKFRF